MRLPKDWKCEAPGCENFGSTTLSQDGSSGWFCMKHMGEQAKGGKIAVEKGGFFEALFTAMDWPHEVIERNPKKASEK